MQQHEVLALASKMFADVGLHNWTFRFNTNKIRRGVCKFTDRRGRPIRRIEMSVHMLMEGVDAIKNTLAHEVAHAIVGPLAGHGPIWRSKAMELGCNGERCAMGYMKGAKSRWIGTCPNGHEHKRFRRPSLTRIQSCLLCHPRFDMRFVVTWMAAK